MKKMIGYGFAITIGLGAITFEMLESLNFWNVAFTADKWYLAYLGFFLTSIAMLGYFYEFLFTANGKTQKTVAIVMTAVCAIGSIVTAGVGFQMTSYTAGGFEFTKDEYDYMALIVQVLIGLHLLALFVYYGGDAIVQAWRDDDSDGVPNFIDKTPKGQPTNAPAMNTNRQATAAPALDIEKLLARIEELEKAQNTPPSQPPTK